MKGGHSITEIFKAINGPAVHTISWCIIRYIAFSALLFVTNGARTAFHLELLRLCQLAVVAVAKRLVYRGMLLVQRSINRRIRARLCRHCRKAAQLVRAGGGGRSVPQDKKVSLQLTLEPRRVRLICVS